MSSATGTGPNFLGWKVSKHLFRVPDCTEPLSGLMVITGRFGWAGTPLDWALKWGAELESVCPEEIITPFCLAVHEKLKLCFPVLTRKSCRVAFSRSSTWNNIISFVDVLTRPRPS